MRELPHNRAQIEPDDQQHPDFESHGYHGEQWAALHPRTAQIARTAAHLDREIHTTARKIPDTHPIWQPGHHEDAAALFQDAAATAALLQRTIAAANRAIFQCAPTEYHDRIDENIRQSLGKIHDENRFATSGHAGPVLTATYKPPPPIEPAAPQTRLPRPAVDKTIHRRIATLPGRIPPRRIR